MGGAAVSVTLGHRPRDHRHALERLDVLRPEGQGGMSRRQAAPLPAAVKKLRCAVYTRKSTEEGLDREFNTLDAQRDACEAYVLSHLRPRPIQRDALVAV